jgi:excisionase family DNA binding protein
MRKREEGTPIDQLAVRISTAAKMVECSESTIRKLLREGKLETTLVGADKRIPVDSIKALLGASKAVPVHQE